MRIKAGKPLQGRIGIRSHVLGYLVLFVAFVIALLWLFQIVLLDSFYKNYKSRQVAGVAEVLISHLDDDSLQATAERLAAQSEVNILLLDDSQEALLSVEGTRNSLIHRVGKDMLAQWCAEAPEDGKPSESLFRTMPELGGMDTAPGGMPHDMPVPNADTTPPEGTGSPDAAGGFRQDRRDLNDWERRQLGFFMAENKDVTNLLYLRRITMPDESAATLLLYAQITPVSATVSALRSQLLVITVIILIFALLLALLISHVLSTPIIETNTAAKALSRARYEKPRHSGAYREIAELNTTLENAARELGQVENLQHELIANISHDLRTPLTMIGGYAEMMRDIPDENTPENMQVIIDEAARLSTLVNELLDFSRMQAGSAMIQPERFALTAAIRAIVNRVGSMVARDGYHIIFEPAEDVSVWADETRIGQVVYNLIGNALTYTGADRTVTVRQKTMDDRIRIEVQDSGKGISREELPLIWNRYYRTRETHRRAIIGSGLGLNIVRAILEQHGAPYGVESEEGHGSCFWFELPLRGEST